MLTLRRFRELSDAYGAELLRWPQDVQGDAQDLLARSTDAREILEAARALDTAIDAARTVQWPVMQDGVLESVRSKVAARIAAPGPAYRMRRSLWSILRIGGGIPQMRPAWVWLAGASTVAVAVGLLIGANFAQEPRADGLLAFLQPDPIGAIHELTD